MRVRLCPMKRMPACLFAVLLSPCVFAQTPSALVSAADAAFSERDYPTAVTLYQQVAESSLPLSVRARAQSRIGYAWYGLQDTAKARSAWLGVSEGFSEEASIASDALLRVGYSYLRDGDYAAAQSAFEAADARFARATDAASNVAEALCQLGKVHLHNAEVAKKSGLEQETGLDAWLRSRPHFEQSRKAFERVEKEYPNLGVWATEARMHLVALKYESAFNSGDATFDDVIAAADSFLSSESLTEGAHQATVRLLRAESFVQQRKFSRAIPDLLAILSGNFDPARPSTGTARYFLARCYEETGSLDKAETEYLMLLEGKEPSFHAESDHAAAEFGLANIRRNQGRNEEAALWYGRLKADHPDSHWSRFADEALATLPEDQNQ